MCVGTYEMVRCSFTGRIRTVGGVGCCFCEKAFLSETTVDLVSRNVVKACSFKTILLSPMVKCLIEKRSGAHDIRAHETQRIRDGVVNVTFSSKVNDPCHIVSTKKKSDKFGVTDVAFNRKNISCPRLGFPRRTMGGICESIKINQSVGWMASCIRELP